jgi:hypothetical protein
MLIWNLYRLFCSLILLAEFVLPITRFQIPASTHMIGQNKYEAKDSKTQRSTQI